ncbi:uncharacterized protein B0T23DRAFT_109088 [Neurospora hispaniola]|uniref:Uncharacterized protein n=1 Tax=Neurospora hispaniola TaxID=588809 RepID=A0AAJ0I9J2_9PEZI|nr:hypothetical protein B0T23DRAFT_109088 [Neurospora hispaniola]
MLRNVELMMVLLLDVTYRMPLDERALSSGRALLRQQGRAATLKLNRTLQSWSHPKQIQPVEPIQKKNPRKSLRILLSSLFREARRTIEPRVGWIGMNVKGQLDEEHKGGLAAEVSVGARRSKRMIPRDEGWDEHMG